jgi:hopanoid biosynthesis associated protein HpnK
MSNGVQLIVHADDFGLSEGVNLAVLYAHREGIVTSTSVMATGDAFDHAMALAADAPSLDIGVHLTLTEHRPVTEGVMVASLVDDAGRFRPGIFSFAAALARGQIDLAHVREELDAQIRKVRATGAAISHLDGHQHVHMLPGVVRIVAELAREHGIPAVRVPAERPRLYMLRDRRRARRLLEQLALSTACTLAPVKALKRVRHFVGFHFGGRLNERNLLTVLEHLPKQGTVELMCHPGYDDPESPYARWQYGWRAELEALSSERIRRWLDDHAVRLVSYRELV